MNINRLQIIIIQLLIIVTTELLTAQPGMLDQGFSGDGKVMFRTKATTINDMLLQSDGKILVAGYNYGNSDFLVARIMENGVADDSFGNNGEVYIDISGSFDYAKSIAILNEDKILVSGFYENDYRSDILIIKLLPNGELDKTFQDSGKVIISIKDSIDKAMDMVVLSDGRILLAGSSYVDSARKNDFLLICLNEDGSFDTTFGDQGIVLTDFLNSQDVANSIEIQEDGKILLAGYSGYMASYDFAMVRYDIDGSIDTTFGDKGKVVTDIYGYSDAVNDIEIQKNGKIILAGKAFTGAGASGNNLCMTRYNQNGLIDSSFNNYGILSIDFDDQEEELNSIDLQADNKIVGLGRIHNVPTKSSDFLMVRIDSSGQIDTIFGEKGFVITDFSESSFDVGYSCIIQEDNKILAAGYAAPFLWGGYQAGYGVARYISGLEEPEPDVDPEDIPSEIAEIDYGKNNIFSIYPNPTTNLINIVYELEEDQLIRIKLIDIIGQVSSILTDDFEIINGKNRLSFQIPSNISEGCYIVTIENSDRQVLLNQIISIY